MKKSTIERFLEKVKVNPITDCWEWTGSIAQRGYGYFWDGECGTKAYRFAYEYYVDVIPSGFEIDHLCRNHSCVNPAHLEVVTHQENVRRGLVGINNKVKTYCPQGHEYTPENTYFIPPYKRVCKMCRRIYRRSWKRKRRQERNNLVMAQVELQKLQLRIC